MIDLEHEDERSEYERPNKSQLKREAQALQDLARDLVELHESVWASFQLSDDMLGELRELKAIAQHGAKKRQLKRVAKLLRDEDVAAAHRAVENAQKQHADVNAVFHKVEQWRDKLLSGGRDEVAEFLRLYGNVHVQELNQLIRNAKHESAKGKSPKSSKLLFKLLKDTI